MFGQASLLCRRTVLLAVLGYPTNAVSNIVVESIRMKRTICAVMAASSLFSRGAQSAFHHCSSSSTRHSPPHSRTPRLSSRRLPQQSALYSTAENDNVMSAFDQAFAKLKAAAPATDPTENLQKKELAVKTTTTTTAPTSEAQTSTSSAAANPTPMKQAKEKLKPRPPQSVPPKYTFLQQQAAQQEQKKTSMAATPSSRRTSAATAPPLPAAAAVASAVTVTPDNSDALLQKSQTYIRQKEEKLLSNTVQQTRQQRKGRQQNKLDSTGDNKERLEAQVATNLISSTVPPEQKGSSANDETDAREKKDRRVVSTIGGKMTVPESSSSKFGIAQTVATWQSWIIGGVMGTVAVTPILLLHHSFFYPEYESLAQWEFDTAVAFVQGAVFAAVYRYAVRDDWDEEKLGKAVFTAFFLVRSLVGIDVSMSCSTPFLFCKSREKVSPRCSVFFFSFLSHRSYQFPLQNFR